MSLFRPNRHPGKLIVVEGIDGCGKSTQVGLLKEWLIAQGMQTAFTSWNSSPLVQPITARGKKRHLLTPATYSLMHAADLADRLERYVIPRLKAGVVVLADRYAYTGYARDVARGLSRKWVRNLYSFALRPNATFYFRLAPAEAFDRLASGGRIPGDYEAGMDLGLSRNIEESFRLLQGRVAAEYDSISQGAGFHVIDAAQPIGKQQLQMRRFVVKILGNKGKPVAKSAPHVL